MLISRDSITTTEDIRLYQLHYILLPKQLSIDQQTRLNNGPGAIARSKYTQALLHQINFRPRLKQLALFMMSSLRIFPAVLATSLVLAACQSAEQKAINNEKSVVSDLNIVCEAQANVDTALVSVSELTPQSTIAEAEKAGKSLETALLALDNAEDKLKKAEVREYRDQVEIFQKHVDTIRKNKEMTLEQAANELKSKVAPLIAASEQLSAVITCDDNGVPSDETPDSESQS